MNEGDKQHLLPKVSVIILNYNRPTYTLDCIASVLQSSYTNIEVIVIDNFSEFSSFLFLKEKMAALNAKLVRTNENLGYAGGNNVGIRHSSGKYILILNDDVIVDSMLIEELVRISEEDDTVGIIGPATYRYNSNELSFYPPDITKSSEEIVDIPVVVGATLMIKREVVRKIGLLDENYFLYHKEWDWCMRARDAGYRTVCATKVRAWHKVNEQGLNYASNWAYYFHRNLFLLAARHCRTTGETLRFLFRHLVWYETKKVPILYPLYALRNRKAEAAKTYFAAIKDGVVLFLKLAYADERRGNC